MNEKTLEDLQFNEVFKELSSQCLSEEGKRCLERKIFVYDEAQLSRYQDIIDDMGSLLDRGIARPEPFCSIQSIISELDAPFARFDGEQLWALAQYVRSAQIFVEFCLTPPEYAESRQSARTLFEPFAQELHRLMNTLFDVLESPGQVKTTHPAIRALKADLDQRRHERQSFSIDFLRSQSTFAQADQPVYRDGRVMLPIKSDQKSIVEGVVHSVSASGATVFMEPYRLVELNNQVVMAEQRILIEIAKILGDLSTQTHACKNLILDLVEHIGEADALYARLCYRRKHNCIRPLVGKDAIYRLVRARHPLLKGHVVPISITIDPAISAVVLSGPNAGGKTVTVKTMGLFVLMHQFFYVVPAAEGTVIPLFNAVYTDIGDDQSIEESLSTFSGHMKRIAHILSSCDKQSLVILDELASQTDPLEGSAIARAILEYCVEHAALTLVTSHHGVLKQYAYAHANVMNASMEFDEKSHQPTFNVIEGLPGESRALETAKRMHLPKQVIKAASAYIGSEQLEISSIIRQLEARRKEIEEAKEQLEQRQSEVRREVREVDLQRLQVRQHELLLRNERLGDLSRFITEKRAELENLVAELREGEITKEKTRKVKAFIQSLEEKESQSRNRLAELEKAQEPQDDSPYSFAVGMDVYAGPSKREGRIVRTAGKGKWVVAIGPMKFTLSEKDLKAVPKSSKQDYASVSVSYQTSSVAPKPIVDVRGFTLGQALSVISNQIESALVHSVGGFSIIHGMGEGILAKGIHEYLATVSQIKSYYYARPEDGGFGKTYVEF